MYVCIDIDIYIYMYIYKYIYIFIQIFIYYKIIFFRISDICKSTVAFGNDFGRNLVVSGHAVVNWSSWELIVV